MIKIAATSENWSIIWQTSFAANGATAYPRQFSPTILTSPIIAVALSATADYWKNQAIGYANQQIETGLIGMGLARANAKKIVFSDEINIISFPFTVNYRLSIDLFKSVATTVAISVYEYIGIIE